MASDREQKAPAGGFGEAGKAPFGPQDGPPRRSSRAMIVIIAVGVALAILVGIGAYAVRSYTRAMQHTMQGGEVRIIAGYVERHYEAAHDLCPTAAPVPPNFEQVLGQYYTVTDRDWNDPGWSCLGYETRGTLPWQLRYERTGPDTFAVSAEADRDADGIRSRFRQQGRIVNGKVVLGPMEETNPDE